MEDSVACSAQTFQGQEFPTSGCAPGALGQAQELPVGGPGGVILVGPAFSKREA
jgi:hypothetical protein